MEKCAEQQRLLFLGMCSLEDRKRICDEKNNHDAASDRRDDECLCTRLAGQDAVGAVPAVAAGLGGQTFF